MKNTIIGSIALFLSLIAISSYAQVLVTPTNIGINTANPLSPLSINADGNSNTALHVSGLTVPTLKHGIISELSQPLSNSDFNYSVVGRITSGVGKAVGLAGSSFNTTPATAGRSYGVFSYAGNATDGYNYGVFSSIRGTHGGAAIVGWDEINEPSWGQNTNGTWAGYFVGKTSFTDMVQIQNGGLEFPDGTIQTTASTSGGSGLWVANGTDISNTNTDNVGIGIAAPLHKLHVSDNLTATGDAVAKLDYSPNISSGLTHGLLVESTPLTDKGQTQGASATTSSTYSSQQGTATGILGLSKAFAADGVFYGVNGSATSNQLSSITAKYSRVIGGNFRANGDNLSLGSGNFWVAGMHATLAGTINNNPTNGAVAAVLGVDENQGTATSWAGYFLGKGHFSDKVTIGTTSMPATIGATNYSLADYKLFVCGGILAEEWLVPNVTWCDYVFDDTYDLTSLKEVEAHIEENGYLHNTPSAEEIEDKGLEVAAMTINQQEKIEEVFLHLIEMNKKMEEMNDKVQALAGENSSLLLKNKQLEQTLSSLQQELKAQH